MPAEDGDLLANICLMDKSSLKAKSKSRSLTNRLNGLVGWAPADASLSIGLYDTCDSATRELVEDLGSIETDMEGMGMLSQSTDLTNMDVEDMLSIVLMNGEEELGCCTFTDERIKDDNMEESEDEVSDEEEEEMMDEPTEGGEE